jgi:hypothetical protein
MSLFLIGSGLGTIMAGKTAYSLQTHSWIWDTNKLLPTPFLAHADIRHTHTILLFSPVLRLAQGPAGVGRSLTGPLWAYPDQATGADSAPPPAPKGALPPWGGLGQAARKPPPSLPAITSVLRVSFGKRPGGPVWEAWRWRGPKPTWHSLKRSA